MPPKPTVKTPPISRMMEGNLIYKPQPVYPPMARAVRVQGAVVLRAIISKTGTIENLQTLSGHPLLVPSAIEAVKRWRYRPYVLNGEPVEVETQVTVNFILSGG
jgi:protein TonB